MTKKLLVLLALAFSNSGCEAEDIYHPAELTSMDRESIEREKRELLKLEEIQIGSGAIAAWGRKVVANIRVWQGNNGEVIYQGPVVAYTGFWEILSLDIPEFLPYHQREIILGLNGMAIGGKRRMMIDPSLVCEGSRSQANPKMFCNLINRGVPVRKEQLIVEATLTESCIPVGTVMSSALGRKTKETGCRRSDFPQRDPSALPSGMSTRV